MDDNHWPPATQEQPNEPAPAVAREDGWYWIKTGMHPTLWVPAYWDTSMEEWRSARAAPYYLPPVDIGPRIPSPDEAQPAPRQHAENCNVHRLRSSEPGAKVCNCGLDCPVSAEELREMADELQDWANHAHTSPQYERRASATAKLRELADWLDKRGNL